MSDIFAANQSGKTFSIPYLTGIMLAVNAVADSCLVVDGLNCVLPQNDLIADNHDLFSTLLSEDGRHRVICTMSAPIPQQADQEKNLQSLLTSISGSRDFSAILLTALPFLRLSGLDYEGLAREAGGIIPVRAVPPLSLEADWLDGYGNALDSLASALPPAKKRPRRATVAVVGYMRDRNEDDHAANMKELRRLLALAGLELVCVFPSGGNFRGLAAALEAQVIVSLPYGRKAARRIAAMSKARLVETGLPMGLAGTSDWLAAVRRAAGLKGSLPPALKKEEAGAAAKISPLLDALAHRKLLFAGDPYLCAAVFSFARELCMRPSAALLDCRPKELGIAALPPNVLFSPSAGEARSAAKKMLEDGLPAMAVSNSFGVTEGMTEGMPHIELGFPSYRHHCIGDEPFLGYAGAARLACRLLNAAQSGAPGQGKPSAPFSA